MRRGTSESRRGRLFALESLAGWVFADMLLVLFLVGVASAIPREPTDPEPTTSPEPTASPEEDVDEEPEQIVGMRPQPKRLSISFDAGALLAADATDPVAESVCTSLREQSTPLEGERAALVLIFGGAAEPTIGQEVARRIEEQLACADESLYPDGTVVRPFWNGSLAFGEADLEVFTFTTNQSDT